MLDRLIDAVVSEMWPIIEPVWESIIFWRVATLVQLLGAVAIYRYRERIAAWLIADSDSIEHDRKIFRTADDLFSEEMLDHFLDDMIGDHSYRSGPRLRLGELVRFLGREGNRFINKDLARSTSTLHDSLEALLRYLAAHFFFYPHGQPVDDQSRYCMYPEYCIDRAGKPDPETISFYSEHTEQLLEIGKAADKTYAEWRRKIKDVLSR